MSIFGSLMGDFEDDPFFGAHMQSMQRMNSMMNSMFADPFGMMVGPPALMGAPNQQNRQIPMPGMQMMPFGFPPMSMNIGRMFSDMENMHQNPNCHSFTSSSVMTMTSGPDGRPQVYQESMSTRHGPGGIKETKKSVSDSMTGTRSLAIGHHIGERAHIIEREQNVHTGDQEERQDYINLDEEEAESFNQEWESKTKRGAVGAIGSSPYRSYGRAQDNRPLALPSTAPSNQQNKNQSRILAAPRRVLKSALSKKNKKSPGSSETTTTATSSNNASPSSSVAKATPSLDDLPENLSCNNKSNTTTTHTTTAHNDTISSNSVNNNTSSNVNSRSSPQSRKRERSPDPEEAVEYKRRSQGDSA